MCQTCLLSKDLLLPLNLLHSLFQLLLLFLQSLLFSKCSRTTAPSIARILNFFLLFGQLSLKARLFNLFSLPLRLARSIHLILLKLHQVVYLPLFLKVLLVSGVLLGLFSFFLLFDSVVLKALLAEHLFLLSDLFDSFDPSLLF